MSMCNIFKIKKILNEIYFYNYLKFNNKSSSHLFFHAIKEGYIYILLMKDILIK